MNKLFELHKKKFFECSDKIKYAFIYTFIWGMAAHGYVFLSKAFSHDSLNEYIATEGLKGWKIQLGRVFVPVYQKILRGSITLPWVIGLLSLVFIAFAVFFVFEIFNVENKCLKFLISGIFTVNTSMIALAATYVHDMDCNMVALLFAVIAVYLWKSYKYGFVFGALFLGVSLGFYQSYISVAIVLIILVCIVEILEKNTFENVLFKGIKSVVMILLSGIFYILCIKIVTSVTGVKIGTGGYNTLDNMGNILQGNIFELVKNTYITTLEMLLKPATVYPVKINYLLHLAMIIATFVCILIYVFINKIRFRECTLIVTLLFVLPIGMNVSRILQGGWSHELMHYAIRLVYFIVIIIVHTCVKNIDIQTTNIKWLCEKGIILAVLLVVWGNVRLANTAYIVKDFQRDATLSMWTRILSKMEDFDGYVPGETWVAFVGNTDWMYERIDHYNNVRELTGMEYISPATNMSASLQNYFRYMLMTKINISGIIPDERTDRMPVYPADGCMQMLDGMLVVKLSE